MGNTILTTAEKASVGLMTTGLGLMVVFIALALIIVIITILSKVLQERKKTAAEAKPVPVAQAAVPAPASQADDAELIAVLTAAVAAQMGDGGNASGLVIRSYRHMGNENAWAEAGKNAQIFNKF